MPVFMKTHYDVPNVASCDTAGQFRVRDRDYHMATLPMAPLLYADAMVFMPVENRKRESRKSNHYPKY